MLTDDMGLCFHNGEQNMKERIITQLRLVQAIKIVEDL